MYAKKNIICEQENKKKRIQAQIMTPAQIRERNEILKLKKAGKRERKKFFFFKFKTQAFRNRNIIVCTHALEPTPKPKDNHQKKKLS